MPDTAQRPDRAVIDIGSNTVRLVIYAGPRRAPRVWLNESVSARLGRDLAVTGRIPGKASKAALGALARYATIVSDLAIPDVQTVATAAARDAANGAGFLDQVRALGLSPRLLSGPEEAYGAAYGVIGAFPEAEGIVADLGGGSLELVEVEHGQCHDGVSMPLGTLRLPALRGQGAANFGDALRREIRRSGWKGRQPGALFLVGGTWRAFGAYAIRAGAYPLSDPHGFSLEVEAAKRLAKEIAAKTPADLELVPGISATRAAGLPDAAALMRALLSELHPDKLTFSSWGLREGLLFQKLPAQARAEDPLAAAVAEFSELFGASPALAQAITDWGSRGVPGEQDTLRLKDAATRLALAAAYVEPNLRPQQSFEWAMEKRWVGLTPADRAWLAAALLASHGKTGGRPELQRLAPPDVLHGGTQWGLTVRLARRLCAGSVATLDASRLERTGGRLVLGLSVERAHLCTAKVAADLKTLAKWCGLEPAVETLGPSP